MMMGDIKSSRLHEYNLSAFLQYVDSSVLDTWLKSLSVGFHCTADLILGDMPLSV